MEKQVLDQELVERVQRGDKKAFDLLVLKYQHKVVSLITRYLKDPVESLDVAQEAFIKAYRAIPSFRGDSAFYTWLYRIAVNTAKNHLVSRGRRPPASDIDADEAEKYDGAVALREYSSPEQLLLGDEVQNNVINTIQGLSDELKNAIVLREIDGMSYDEIALVMDCPVGTVRSRIFRAREAIQEKLKPLISTQ